MEIYILNHSTQGTSAKQNRHKQMHLVVTWINATWEQSNGAEAINIVTATLHLQCNGTRDTHTKITPIGNIYELILPKDFV